MADISSITLPSGNSYNIKDTTARQQLPWCIVDSTSTSTAFTATVDGVTKLESGVCFVCFNNKVASASGCTINVNSLGAKPIYRTDAAATRVTTQFAKNVTWLFIYNETRVTGGCWDMAYLYDTNSTYAGYSFGLGYGVCDTAEATVAKTCAISSYALSNGGIVSVKFTHTVCDNATLNINSKGAKPIYFRGVPIIKQIIYEGDIATFQYYNDCYYLIAIDRLCELTNSVARGSVEGSTILGYSAEEDGDGYHPNIATQQFSLAHGGALGFNIKITGAANTTTYTYSKSAPDMLDITTKTLDKYLTLSLGYSYLTNGTSDDDNVIRSKILSVDTDNATITIQSPVSDTALNNAEWYLLVPSIASAHASTSGGSGTIASASASTAIGQATMAISSGSFAEGFATIAGADGGYTDAHAEGCASVASGYASHAEGVVTESTGFMSHSEGYLTVASGMSSHSEGEETNTSGRASHAEGTGTIANRANQHASGSYNISDAVGSANVRGTYIEIVGNGTSTSARSNARTLDWSGNEWVAGKVSAGTVANPAPVTADNDLTTKKYVDDAVEAASGTQYTASSSKLVTTTVPNITSIGTAPTLGTAIPADDITAWTTNVPTSFTVSGEKLSIITGTAASLSYTAKSIPNVTSVGTAPTLGDSITVATGSLSANASGASIVTGITAYDLPDGQASIYTDLTALQNQVTLLSDSKQNSIAVVQKTLSDTSVTLAADSFYVFPEMSQLAVTCPVSGSTAFRFISGATPTVLSMSGVTLPDDYTGTKANRVYEVNINDGYALITSWAVEE